MLSLSSIFHFKPLIHICVHSLFKLNCFKFELLDGKRLDLPIVSKSYLFMKL